MDERLLLSGSIGALRIALDAKHIAVRELVGWYLQRIEKLDRDGPKFNAVRELIRDPDAAIAVAQRQSAAEKPRNPLHGIPVLLKDNVATEEGMAMTVGSAAFASFAPRRDATIARRLRAAGAIILGKTNLTEFADYLSDVMPSGFSSAGGLVKNPHGFEFGRGLGSSVGSAAAVAAGLVPVAIGSETQNSLQAPACAASVYAYKPSVGLVSRDGVVPLVPSQDSPGVIARTFEDLVLVLRVIAGRDCRDTATFDVALSDLDRLRPRDPRSLRVGIPRRTFTDKPDLPAAADAFSAVLSKLSGKGVEILDPCDLPSAEQMADLRSSVFRTEFKCALNTFLAEHEHPCGIDSIDRLVEWYEANPNAMPYGHSLLVAASQAPGLRDPLYRRDRLRDVALSRNAGIDAALAASGVDVLMVPMSAAAKFTGKAGAPVLAIPVGFDGASKPFGVTIFSSFGSDRRVLEVGSVLASIVGDRRLPTCS